MATLGQTTLGTELPAVSGFTMTGGLSFGSTSVTEATDTSRQQQYK